MYCARTLALGHVINPMRLLLLQQVLYLPWVLMARVKQFGSLVWIATILHRGWGDIVHIRVDCTAQQTYSNSHPHHPR